MFGCIVHVVYDITRMYYTGKLQYNMDVLNKYLRYTPDVLDR